MNYFHVLIAGLVLSLLGLVVFGGPSMSEIRKRNEERKTKNLVEKIMKSANENSALLGEEMGSSRKPPTGLNAGMDTSLDLMVENPINRPNANRPKYGNLPEAFRNPYLSSSQRRTPRGMPVQEAPVVPQDSYYPPPPEVSRRKPRSSYQGEPANRNGIKNGIDSAVLKAMQGTMDSPYGTRMEMPDLTEESLKQFSPTKRALIKAKYEKTRPSYFVAFEGTKAYIKDELGAVKPMPDGYYQMPGSKHTVLIRGGKKVMPN